MVGQCRGFLPAVDTTGGCRWWERVLVTGGTCAEGLVEERTISAWVWQSYGHKPYSLPAPQMHLISLFLCD